MTVYRPLIESVAKTYGLDCNLVEAVVIAESNAFTDSFRFEPAFYDRYLKDKPEYAGMNPRRISSSYGLMQVMYSTAKQYGFGDLPELLFLPDVGLKFGCQHLAKLIGWANGNVARALGAYNAGPGNAESPAGLKYSARVLALYRAVEQAHPQEATS